MSKKLLQGNSYYSAPLAKKTVKILSRILTSAPNPGISELASDLGIAKSTTHGILTALEESGWVLRDPVTRRYTCGHALNHLSGTASVRLPLTRIARPHIEALAAAMDEDVFLGMFTVHSIVILDQAESPKRLKVSTRPGTRLPIFAGGAGKIFLAFHDEDALKEALESTEIPCFTSRSVTDPKVYMEQLTKIREQGYALDEGEYITDVNAISVPIFHGKSTRKRVVAGIWAVGLSSDLTWQKMEAMVDYALEIGSNITNAISEKYDDV